MEYHRGTGSPALYRSSSVEARLHLRRCIQRGRIPGLRSSRLHDRAGCQRNRRSGDALNNLARRLIEISPEDSCIMQNLVKQAPGDPSGDIFQYGRQSLDYIFKPQNVAVVGATEKPGSVGRTILWNLISSPFGGTVYPINPKRTNVLGIRAYPSLSDVTEKIVLAVDVEPAPT